MAYFSQSMVIVSGALVSNRVVCKVGSSRDGA
jgi:hypothetical protein